MAESENFYVRILVRLGHYNEAEALVKLHRLERQRTDWRDKKRRSSSNYGRNLWTTADQVVLDGIEAQIAKIRQELTDGPLLIAEELLAALPPYTTEEAPSETNPGGTDNERWTTV